MILSKNVDLISGIFQKYNITSSKFDVVLKLVQQALTLTGFFNCIMNYSIHAKVEWRKFEMERMMYKYLNHNSQTLNFSFDMIFIHRNLVFKFTINRSTWCSSLLASKPKLGIDLYGYTFIVAVPATCEPKQTVWAKSQCRIPNVIYNRTTSTCYTDMIPRCALIPLKPSFHGK